MAVELIERKNGKILEAHVTDKLTAGDYQRFGPIVEKLVKQHGKIRILFDMTRFHGWEAKAVWDDIKFDIKHFNDIDRIAMVGETKWQQWMAVFCKPFTTAQVRYFDQTQSILAQEWIEGQ